NSSGPSNAGDQSAHGGVYFEGGRGGPDQLRCIVERGVGQHSNNSLDADVNSVPWDSVMACEEIRPRRSAPGMAQAGIAPSGQAVRMVCDHCGPTLLRSSPN